LSGSCTAKTFCFPEPPTWWVLHTCGMKRWLGNSCSPDTASFRILPCAFQAFNQILLKAVQSTGACLDSSHRGTLLSRFLFQLKFKLLLHSLQYF
jgi:hypothetical protein